MSTNVRNQCRGESYVYIPNNYWNQTYMFGNKSIGFKHRFIYGFCSAGEHKVRPYIGFGRYWLDCLIGGSVTYSMHRRHSRPNYVPRQSLGTSSSSFSKVKTKKFEHQVYIKIFYERFENLFNFIISQGKSDSSLKSNLFYTTCANVELILNVKL